MRRTIGPRYSAQDLVNIRRSTGLMQVEFWGKFGVLQASGSRYERGEPIPKPTELLVALYFKKRIDDQALAEARKTIGMRTIPPPER